MKNLWPLVILLLVIAFIVYQGMTKKKDLLTPPTAPTALDSKPLDSSASAKTDSRSAGPPTAEAPSKISASVQSRKEIRPSAGGGGEKIDAAKKRQLLQEQSVFK